MACLSFPQFDGEPFYAYFERLDGFLSYHGCSLNDACGIAYWGMNEYTRGMVEDMNNGRFCHLSMHDAWDFFTWLAKDSLDRESHVSYFDSQCQDSFNFCMNSLDTSYVPSDNPSMQIDTFPPYAHFDEVCANFDDVQFDFDHEPQPNNIEAQILSQMQYLTQQLQELQEEQKLREVRLAQVMSALVDVNGCEAPHLECESVFENDVGQGCEVEGRFSCDEGIFEDFDPFHSPFELECHPSPYLPPLRASLGEDVSEPSSILNEGFHEDDDDEFEQSREIESPLSDGGRVVNEENIDFEVSNPLPHLDESTLHVCDPSIHESLDSFEVMASMFIEGVTNHYSLLREFIGNASWERDEFERNLYPFMHGLETLGFEDLEGVVVHRCDREEDEVVSIGEFLFEGDVSHECSFEDSMIDFHALIGDVRLCETIVSPPLPHVPFSRKFDHISYYPMFLPSFVKEPIEDPLLFDETFPSHPPIIEEMGDYATQKDFEEVLPFYSFPYFSSSFSSYFLDFSFDFSSFFWHLPPHLRAIILLHVLLPSFAYLLSYEMCSSAFDKLLRSLQYYLLERSRLDVKQAFLGK